MTKINLLNLKGLSIFEQLQIEEALLRLDDRDWCLINSEAPPAIVLGISAAPDRFIDKKLYLEKPVPVIRRFSGGGTVFIDENTLFVTFIFNSGSNPEKAMQWSEEFYRPIFSPLPFSLRENDYTIGEKKMGGNAQYFCKNRFLHHTSFLFDYDKSNMDFLLFPEKTPKYREGRDHASFLQRLNEHFPDKSQLIDKICQQLESQFTVQQKKLEEVLPLKIKPHRKSTTLLNESF